MASKCPVCKKKVEEVYDALDNLDGYKCSDGHYEFSDRGGTDGGFGIRIGQTSMSNLYSGSVKQCRLQNIIIKRWVQRERKKLKKHPKIQGGNQNAKWTRIFS